MIADLLSNRFLLFFCLTLGSFALAAGKPRLPQLLETWAALAWGLVFALLLPRFTADVSWAGQTFILFDSLNPLFLGLGFLMFMGCACQSIGPMAIGAIIAAAIAETSPFVQPQLLAGGLLRFTANEGLLNVLVFALPLVTTLMTEDHQRNLVISLFLTVFLGAGPALLIIAALQAHETPVFLPFRAQVSLGIILGIFLPWLETLNFRPLSVSLIFAVILGAFFLIQPAGQKNKTGQSRFIWNPA